MDHTYASRNEIEVIYEDSDQGGKEEIEDVDEVERKHLEVLAEAKKLSTKNVSEFQGLIKRRLHDVMERRTDDKRTFLHVVAADVSPTVHVRWLVASVLAYQSGVRQMGEVDDEKKTPLYTAITSSNKHFLTAATGRPSSDTTIKRVGDALAIEAARSGEKTSLHVAVTNQRKISTELLLKIIQIAPKEIFGVQDESGHTPLHLAVHYSRCMPKQLTVVRELIARNPSVLERTTTSGHSVYQFHMNSRPSPPAPESGESAVRMASGQPSHKASDRVEKPVAGPSIAAQRPNTSKLKDYDREPMPGIERRRSMRKPSLSMVTQVESSNPPSAGTPVELHRPAATNLSSSTTEARRSLSKALETSADEVRDELKLQSLRVMPCDVAFRCLLISGEMGKQNPTCEILEEVGGNWAY